MAYIHQALDPSAQISDIGNSVRRLLDQATLPLGALLLLVTAALYFAEHPGTECFALTATGSMVILMAWRSSGLGLPIVPMLALQNLLSYGLPIIINNESVMDYPGNYMTLAGVEVLIFSCCLTGMWQAGMRFFSISPPGCFALQGFRDQNMSRLGRVGFGLVVAATGYVLLRTVGHLDTLFSILPEGSYPIVNVLASGVSTCGFFLGAMVLGKGGMSPIHKVLFWLMLALQCYIGAASLLLSSTTTIVFSVLIGLFWSTGRVPWTFLAVVFVVTSFLNLGKSAMRDRYWNQEQGEPAFRLTLTELPSYYQEWTTISYNALVGADEPTDQTAFDPFGDRRRNERPAQSIFDRINNLQNILFVIDAMSTGNRSPLGGATYAMIPPLLVPRILWPEKPRTHEGQVLLNVHFGRQDLQSTFQTYIAWGILAEAYGNFGPKIGAALLGLFLGFFFAWLEKRVANKLILSLEGFLAFTFFLGIANSSEMVSTVLITSLFQAFIPIILASWPFVRFVRPTGSNAPFVGAAENG